MRLLMLTTCFLAWLAASLWAWWRWYGRGPDRPEGSARLLGACVLLGAQWLTAATALGIAHQLHLPGLLATNGLITVGLWIAGRTTASRSAPPPVAPGEVYPALTIAAAALLGGWLFLLAVLVMAAARLGVSDCDGLMYHIPIPAVMLQSANLEPIGQHFDLAPRNVEMLFLYVLAFFRNDVWLDACQMPFVLLGLLAVYTMIRRLAPGPRAPALIGALVFGFTPLLLAQMRTAYVDAAMAGLTLAGICLAATGPTAVTVRQVLALGAVSGLLLGGKYTGPVIVIGLLGIWGVRSLRAGAPAGKVLGALVAAGVMALLTGGYLYLRLWADYGNPIYPNQVAIGGHVIFPGPRESLGYVYGAAETAHLSAGQKLAASWLGWREHSYSPILGGFGPLWILGLLATPVAAVLVARRRRTEWLWPLGLIWLLLALTPMPYMLRYCLFLPAAGSLALVACLLYLPRLRAWLASLVVAGACLTTVVVEPMGYLYAAWSPAPDAQLQREDPCRTSAHPPHYRPAYGWIRDHLGRGDRITLLATEAVFSLSCFWTPRYDNVVAVRDVQSVGQIDEEVAREPGSHFLLAKGPLWDAWSSSTRHAYEMRFEDDAVVIFRATQAP